MDSLSEKNVGLGNHRLTRGQPGVESSVRIRNLEPYVGREEKETVTGKAGLAEGTKRTHSEFDTSEIRSEAKERATPLNRRRKIRVYFPRNDQTHR